MRDDYRFAIDDLPPRPVSQLTSAEINDLISFGIYVMPDWVGEFSEEQGLERLRIELIIRQLGL
jgi:hypothetical protein